jgi:putative NADH-flavin reductase
MKVTVFGATGRTGKHVVEEALEKGFLVVAFTRSPQRMDSAKENLTVFEGDIQDAQKVAAAIAGADAVISALGPTDNKAQFVVSTGMNNILAGMHQHGVSRLVVSAGAGVGDVE